MDTSAATRSVHPRRPLYAWRGTSYRASCPSVSTRPRDVLNGGRAAGTALYVSQNGGKSAASQAATWSFRAVTARPQDRKSTRLNSSHVAISYAVFCLKKKKKREAH